MTQPEGSNSAINLKPPTSPHLVELNLSWQPPAFCFIEKNGISLWICCHQIYKPPAQDAACYLPGFQCSTSSAGPVQTWAQDPTTFKVQPHPQACLPSLSPGKLPLIPLSTAQCFWKHCRCKAIVNCLVSVHLIKSKQLVIRMASTLFLPGAHLPAQSLATRDDSQMKRHL